MFSVAAQCISTPRTHRAVEFLRRYLRIVHALNLYVRTYVLCMRLCTYPYVCSKWSCGDITEESGRRISTYVSCMRLCTYSYVCSIWSCGISRTTCKNIFTIPVPHCTHSMYDSPFSVFGCYEVYVRTYCVLCLWLVRILCTYVHHCVSLVRTLGFIVTVHPRTRSPYGCHWRIACLVSLRIVGLSIILQQRTRYMMSLVCLWLSWD
jgi:hypothetical protein